MTQTPPPTTAAGRDCHRHLPLSSQGNPRKATMPRGPKARLPGRASLRETYREDEQRCCRWCGGSDGRRETAPADGRAGRPGSRGAGAACVEPRSPAPTAAAAAAAAAALRLQWSAAPQPLLSHGRGALAGRCSRLPAPGSRWLAELDWNRCSPDLLDTFSEPPGEPRAGRAEPRDARGLTAWAHLRPAPLGRPLLSRDHSRGALDPADPGLSAVETTRFALAPASGGGPAGPSARGPESSRSITVGERIRKRTAARSPPRRRCPARLGPSFR
ncbi:unnamed protein product [Rangifer tarandus platyrhynchus]|nr:unnamed protein product [Rangifer tarandus platyrhynchus]CAI9693491.1 unnamed protein product [Rangifer tarandus platyrhynchus]